MASESSRLNTSLIAAPELSRRNLQTTNLSVDPVRTRTGEIIAYNATTTVTAQIRGIARAGRAVDAAVSAGATVQGPTLLPAQEDRLYQRALNRALREHTRRRRSSQRPPALGSAACARQSKAAPPRPSRERRRRPPRRESCRGRRRSRRPSRRRTSSASRTRAVTHAPTSRSTSRDRAAVAAGERGAVEGHARVTPEPQYATRSPSGSSGSGLFHGAFSAPGIRPGTSSIGFGSPRQRLGTRASTSTRARVAETPQSSSASIVSSVPLARDEVARLDASSPRAAARPRPRCRRARPRTRRVRSGVGATRAARRRRPSRRRRQARRRRCRRGPPLRRTARPREADAARRPEPTYPRGPRRRRGTTRQGCALRVQLALPGPDRPSSQRQSTNWYRTPGVSPSTIYPSYER